MIRSFYSEQIVQDSTREIKRWWQSVKLHAIVIVHYPDVFFSFCWIQLLLLLLLGIFFCSLCCHQLESFWFLMHRLWATPDLNAQAGSYHAYSKASEKRHSDKFYRLGIDMTADRRCWCCWWWRRRLTYHSCESWPIILSIQNTSNTRPMFLIERENQRENLIKTLGRAVWQTRLKFIF